MWANPEPRGGRGVLPGRPGPWALGLLLVVVGVIPLFWDGRYYFRGDTQAAYVGWWYHLGEQVREGHLPLMEPLAWEAGNYVAEGQWGLFSPLTILIGLATTVVPDLVVFVTALKVGLVVLGGTGTYLVARSYQAREPFALIAGLVVGLSGQSVFNEWPSWVNGQIGAALLPWAWWSIRRAMAGRGPGAALVVCYLVAAVGYVYCAIYLAVILAGCLLDAVLGRSRRTLLTVLAIGAFSGLVVVAVYLPGVLTAPVTTRAGWSSIVGRGPLTTDVQGLFSSMLPTLKRNYLVWLLPTVLWMDLGRLHRTSRDLAGAVLGTVVLTLGVLGPSAVGPLRWPMRMVPALMVTLVVLLAVMASRCLPSRVTRLRLALSFAWVAGAAYVVVARDPAQGKEAAAGVAVLVLALGMAAWSLARRSAPTTTGLVMLWTVGIFAVQYALHPVPPAADRNMPAAPSQYSGRITSASGDVMVLGAAASQVIHNPAVADEMLIGSAWYLDPHDVQNGYTTINFRTFRSKFCRNFMGETCASAIDVVQSTEPTTGRRWLDLLSVSTLVLYRPVFPRVDLMDPPEGWGVSEVTTYTVVWTRDQPVPTAGGVVATSGGVGVAEESVTSREVRLRVASVGSQGGTVTLSRLAWPGYQVEGATLADPLGGMLVRVAVPAGSDGSTITLRWDPPGWTVERLSLWTAVLAGVLWVVLRGVRRSRRHPGEPEEQLPLRSRAPWGAPARTSPAPRR